MLRFRENKIAGNRIFSAETGEIISVFQESQVKRSAEDDFCQIHSKKGGENAGAVLQ